MKTYECIAEGCTKGPATGHGLYRTSPKGEGFKGACEEHFGGEPDPIVQAIERSNQQALGVDEPCQPIGCDNGYHLPGCVFAEVDDAE